MHRLALLALSSLLLLPAAVAQPRPPDAPVPVPAPAAQPQHEVRIYVARHRDARSLTVLVSRFLGGHPLERAEYDSATNSIVVQTTAENHKKLQALISALDTKEAAASATSLASPEGLRVTEVEIYAVRHADLDNLSTAIQRTVLQYPDERLAVDSKSRALVIRTTRVNHGKVAALLKALDRPAPTVEVTLHLLHLGMEDGTKDAEGLSKELAETARKLLSVFTFKRIERLDTLVAQGRVGSMFQATHADSNFTSRGILEYDEADRTLSIRNLQVTKRLATGKLGERAGIYNFESSVNVAEGKTVAIGASMGERGGLVLVVSARIVK